ncbi:hypothetical protein ACIRA0001_1548 [Acinetobacter radioresistens SK82]|uniref:Uncharacterized protein n=1 Tax=Acinetobacter radioresistens SK82 TaxID=596318 RepID=A0ABM9YJS9_ACIRA|nr:hypothetical protein ACIRA0001_1548 [Acinetobacter radioresistens SK82]
MGHNFSFASRAFALFQAFNISSIGKSFKFFRIKIASQFLSFYSSLSELLVYGSNIKTTTAMI